MTIFYKVPDNHQLILKFQNYCCKFLLVANY